MQRSGQVNKQIQVPKLKAHSSARYNFRMSLTLDEVHHIANLARLELTEEEIQRYREQLSAILAYFEQLQALDTTGIAPTTSTSDGQSLLREDQARQGLSLDNLLDNAPQTKARQFRVPPVFDNTTS